MPSCARALHGLTGYIVANIGKDAAHYKQRYATGDRKFSRGRKIYVTSLFCSVFKCRLMLSIMRTINIASAEIIDGFSEIL